VLRVSLEVGIERVHGDAEDLKERRPPVRRRERHPELVPESIAAVLRRQIVAAIEPIVCAAPDPPVAGEPPSSLSVTACSKNLGAAM